MYIFIAIIPSPFPENSQAVQIPPTIVYPPLYIFSDYTNRLLFVIYSLCHITFSETDPQIYFNTIKFNKFNEQRYTEKIV